jgi:TRAP-type mannitol/chloroaromatic compound transport system substrate-binding protein
VRFYDDKNRNKVKEEQVKKILIIPLALLLAITLVVIGCPAPPAGGTTPPAMTSGPNNAAPSAPESHKWTMTTVLGYKDEEVYPMWLTFADRVKEESGGRLEIEVVLGGELFPITQEMDNVSRGVIEIAQTNSIFLAGLDPAWKIAESLAGFPANPYMWNAIGLRTNYTDYWNLVSGWWAELNCHLVGEYFVPPEILLSSKPVYRASDFEGLKIRTAGTSEDLFKKLGASTMFVPSSEIYTAIQLGTVDVVEWAGAASDWQMGLQEVTKYIIEPTFHANFIRLPIIANMDAYNSLSPDVQAILDGVGRDMGMFSGSAQNYLDLQYRQRFIDYGLEVCTLPPEDIAMIEDLAKEVFYEYRDASPRSSQLVDVYEPVLKLYGYLD